MLPPIHLCFGASRLNPQQIGILTFEHEFHIFHEQ